MFVKSSLVALAIALSTSATPLFEGTGTRVAFQKRNVLMTEDGLFDHKQAVVQVYRDKSKQRQNLKNLEENLGSQALNKGAKILPLSNMTDFVGGDDGTVEKRQAEPLTDQSNDVLWTGPIAIGSNQKSFVIDFDTGSSDLWVPNVACKSSVCKPKNKYDPKSSTTSKAKSGKFEIQYGDGSSVSGPIYTDTVSIAGVTVTNQYFSPVTTLSSMFANEPDDGILGLAFPALSQLKHSPWFNSAKSQGAVASGVFGFKLAKSGSELYLGGTDTNLYSGTPEYHPVVGFGFWQLAVASILIGDNAVVSGFQTIIDSGTTIIYGPPDKVATFYKQIPNSKLYDKDNGFYSFPCASIPSNVAFSWGGQSWTISAANFNFGRISSTSTRCIGAIAGLDLGLGTDVWLLGDSFMKNVYSVFSFDSNAVGFAALT